MCARRWEILQRLLSFWGLQLSRSAAGRQGAGAGSGAPATQGTGRNAAHVGRWGVGGRPGVCLTPRHSCDHLSGVLPNASAAHRRCCVLALGSQPLEARRAEGRGPAHVCTRKRAGGLGGRDSVRPPDCPCLVRWGAGREHPEWLEARCRACVTAHEPLASGHGRRPCCLATKVTAACRSSGRRPRCCDRARNPRGGRELSGWWGGFPAPRELVDSPPYTHSPRGCPAGSRPRARSGLSPFCRPEATPRSRLGRG